MPFWKDRFDLGSYKERKERERLQKQKDNEDLRDVIFNQIPEFLSESHEHALGKPRVVTCPQGIVTYQLMPKTFGDGLAKAWDLLLSSSFADNPQPNTTDQKIREMYAANPSIDFRNYEEVLQIKVIRQERTRQTGNSIIIGVDDD